MLNAHQKQYISSIPEDQIAKINPYNPAIEQAFFVITARIKEAGINLPVRLLGSGSLKIAGNNDADISILCSAKDQEKFLPALVNIFGEPKKGISIIKWELNILGVDVEMYLTDPNKESTREQLKLMDIFAQHPELVAEYEKIKLEHKDKPMRVYMEAKYNFFNHLIAKY